MHAAGVVEGRMVRGERIPAPLIFFGLTFILSWAIWLPLDASHYGIGPFSVSEDASALIRLLGVLMPAVAAIVLTARAGGRAAIGRLFRRLLIWRVGWRWWGAALLLQPVLLVACAVAWNVAGGRPETEVIRDGLSVFAVQVVFLLIATLGEEIGWRGVALPGLQRTSSPLVASLVLGGLWAMWHLPFWLLLDTFDQFGVGYLVLNVALVVPTSIYITWFFNHSRSSLLLPVAFHLGFNAVNVAWFPVTTTIGPFVLFIAVQLVLAGFVGRHLNSAARTGPG